MGGPVEASERFAARMPPPGVYGQWHSEIHDLEEDERFLSRERYREGGLSYTDVRRGQGQRAEYEGPVRTGFDRPSQEPAGGCYSLDLPAGYRPEPTVVRDPLPRGYPPGGFQGRPARGLEKPRFAREVIAGGPPSVNQAYPRY